MCVAHRKSLPHLLAPPVFLPFCWVADDDSPAFACTVIAPRRDDTNRPFLHTHTLACAWKAVVWRTWQFCCVLSSGSVTSKKKHAPTYYYTWRFPCPPSPPQPHHVQHTDSACLRLTRGHICLHAQGRRPRRNGFDQLRRTANEIFHAGRAWFTEDMPTSLQGQAHLHTRITTHNDIYTHIRRRLQGCCEAEGRRTRAGSHDEGVVHAGLLISAATTSAIQAKPRPPHASPAPARLARAHGAC